MKTCPFCAEQIQPAAIRCRYCGAAQVASSNGARAATGSIGRGNPLAPILGLAGAGLMLLGSAVPYATDSGNGYAVFGLQFGQWWWGIESVVAVVIASVASILLLTRPAKRWFGGVLVGVGAQSIPLFAAYIGYTMTSGLGSHVGAGGFLGLLGAGAVLAGGLVCVLTAASAPTSLPAAAPAPSLVGTLT